MTSTSTQTQPQTTTHRDLYQNVTDIIVKQLENGTVPWSQPWVGTQDRLLALPKNFATGNTYRGINIVLLWSAAIEKKYTENEWATYKQWQEKKEAVRKDEKGSMIVYYDTFEKEVDGENKKIPFLKSSIVFNKCQLAGYKPPEKQPAHLDTPLWDFIHPVEIFVENTKAIIEHSDRGACYLPLNDKINMPYQEHFINTLGCTATEGYYSTLMHELTHWSGSPNRMNRTKGKRFGDNEYAFEELVAELGASFLCADFGMAILEKGDHANYIATWLKVLKGDKHFIVTAASEASKSAEYLKGLQPN